MQGGLTTAASPVQDQDPGPPGGHVPVAPLAALTAAALMIWHLSVPALWLDESVSVVAIQRSWPNLGRAFDGPDAPLVPYYAVLKAITDLSLTVLPWLGDHPALLVRWPSAAAVVVTAGLLTRWVQRIASTSAAALCAALFLLMSGVSRYGQEARPYALVLMFAVIATVTWWTAFRGARWAWAAYAIAVTCLVALNVLAAILILVHACAAILVPPPLPGDHARSRPRQRIRLLLYTCGCAAAGLAVTAPLSVLAIQNGRGAKAFSAYRPYDLIAVWLSNAVGSGRYMPVLAAALLALCAAGVTQVSSVVYGDLVRLATLWAAVPPLVWAVAAWVRPNLLIGRYVLFAIPGMAILAAIGVLTAAGFAVRAVTGADRPGAARTLTGAFLVIFTVLQAPALVSVRSAAGHGEDIRPILVAADRPPYRDLPIYVQLGGDTVVIQTTDPPAVQRVLNVTPQFDRAQIWPIAQPPARVRTALTGAGPVVFIVRRTRCLPAPAARLGYREIAQLPAAKGWYGFVAARSAGRVLTECR